MTIMDCYDVYRASKNLAIAWFSNRTRTPANRIRTHKLEIMCYD